MFFDRPFLLALLLPLMLLCWKRPLAGYTQNILRACLYISIVLAIAGLKWQTRSNDGICIAVSDRSRSLNLDAIEAQKNDIAEIDRKRPAESRLGVISFAAKPEIEKLPDEAPFDSFKAFHADTDASNVAAAIEAALAAIPLEASGRILLLGDGQWTGTNPAQAFAHAAARRIPVDYRFRSIDRSRDVAIVSFEAPIAVRQGERYTIECMLHAAMQENVTVDIKKGNAPWHRRDFTLRRGLNRLAWTDTGRTPGTSTYTVRVNTANEDPCPENNTAQRMLTVRGRRRLLILTESPTRNLAALLKHSGFDVVTAKPSPAMLTPEHLADVSCLILENVSASRLGLSGMQLLAGLVRSGAMGLLMTGGRSSFANGGYHKSPLEELLPLSLEQRNEERKARVAIMVALDRSGSMAAQAGNVTKMDLANRATSELMTLLKPDDDFGVIAVDSEVHEVLPLAKVSTFSHAQAKILAIESMGGGIFTYTALHSATNALLKSKAQVRHLILFADASDAEEPGRYRELLANVTAAGITVSVIGLGTDNDPDASFLMDVALRGRGICYFTSNPEELPRVFAEDTFQVALKTFIEEPVTCSYTADATALSPSLTGQLAFNGYNLTFLKPDARCAIISRDDNKAPICAFHQAGLGKCAAITAEVDGEYTGPFANDKTAPTLLSSLVNWTAADSGHGDFMLTQSVRKGTLHIELELDPERTSDPFSAPPVATTVLWNDTRAPNTIQNTLKWSAPDRLEADIPMPGISACLTTITTENGTESLPPVSQPFSPEFAWDEQSPRFLAQLAKSTGGHERLRPAEVWNRISGRTVTRDLTPLLALIATILLLAEVLERRTAFCSRLFATAHVFKLPRNHTIPPAPGTTTKTHYHKSPRKAAAPSTPTPPTPTATDEPPSQPPQPPQPGDTLLSQALRKAKRK